MKLKLAPCMIEVTIAEISTVACLNSLQGEEIYYEGVEVENAAGCVER